MPERQPVGIGVGFLGGLVYQLADWEGDLYRANGIPATDAPLDTPVGVATDAAGNLYVADAGNQRLRRIDLTGTVELVAGTGERGYSGDGGHAARARFDSPAGVAVDAVGNVYVADFGNRRIRRIDSTGVVTTFAGAGEGGDSGDGGAATEARLDGPASVTSDAAGNVLVAGPANHRIRRIDTVGTISTLAGTGEAFDRADGGRAALARFSHELGGVSTDADGNLYVADAGNHVVRRIDAAEMISTVAGGGTAGFGGDDGPATEARLSGPRDVSAAAAGNLYIADTVNRRVRKIDLAGTITTFAGTGIAGYLGELGYALDSGTYYILWWVSNGLLRPLAFQASTHDRFVRHRLDRRCMLRKSVEQHAATAQLAAVEAEPEFVQIAVQIMDSDLGIKPRFELKLISRVFLRHPRILHIVVT